MVTTLLTTYYPTDEDILKSVSNIVNNETLEVIEKKCEVKKKVIDIVKIPSHTGLRSDLALDDVWATTFHTTPIQLA